jgi:hypothetical protein
VIGRELKVAFDLPQDLSLPPKILALVKQLDQDEISILNFD